ncbi:MAG: FAD-binding oxidoreductase [Saprospiraceae bacterium]|nr:FAD-binding oxidoreductase [Saprospiraceae bacterium]MDW8485328.1 FAD-dependent oxidoreductase [Saprospiraceae bacterium]
MLKYNLSYWERETFFKDFDVAVLGCGLVGLTAALHLKRLQPRLNVAILERGALPAGASTRNAGFACYGSMTELLDDMSRMSADDVFSIVEKRWKGLQRLRQLVGDEHMDFQPCGGFEIFTDDEEEIFRECRERMPDFNQVIGQITGHPQPYIVADEHIARFGFRRVAHLILNQPEGQIHPGKMMARLLQLADEAGVRIFNGVHILSIEDSSCGVELQTAAGWVLRVPRVLVAVNGFARQLMPNLEVTPARNQVLITHPIPGLRVQGCFHYDRGYYYFRNVDGRILLGGGRHLDYSTETTSEFGPNELIRSALVQLLKTIICPGQPIEVDAWWTGILGLGPIKKPIVEQYSKHIVVAVRLSGMGIAIGSLVGEEGAERLLAL